MTSGPALPQATKGEGWGKGISCPYSHMTEEGWGQISQAHILGPIFQHPVNRKALLCNPGKVLGPITWMLKLVGVQYQLTFSSQVAGLMGVSFPHPHHLRADERGVASSPTPTHSRPVLLHLHQQGHLYSVAQARSKACFLECSSWYVGRSAPSSINLWQSMPGETYWRATLPRPHHNEKYE